MTNKNQSQIIKTNEVGEFYFIHDGSKTGHPGLIVWKDDEKNLYIAIKFGTTKNDDNELLSERISQANNNCIYKRLFVGKRKDFGKDELNHFHLVDEIFIKLKEIWNNNFKFSKNISKAQKKFIDQRKNVILINIKK